MPSGAHTFTIVPTSDKVALDERGRGQISVTICNTTEKPARGEIKLAPLGSTRLEWLKVNGEQVRVFSNRQSHQFTVEIQLPAGATGGKYTFRPNVATVENPDDDFTEGPELVFEFKGALPKTEPQKKFPIWIIFLILGLVLVGGVIAAVLLIPKGSSVQVVSVVGKAVGEASHMLEEAKLKPATEEEVTRTNAPGIVFAQNPAAGEKLKEGATVTLTVEGQPAANKVPDVVGMPFAKIKDAFGGLGFEFVQKDSRLTGNAPVGNVLEQTPRASELASAGSQVALTVEGDSVAVPNVVGMLLDKASTTLTGGRLSIADLTKEKRADLPDDSVIRQTPAAGQRAVPGSVVALVISEKPPTPPPPGGVRVNPPPKILFLPPLPAPALLSPPNGKVFFNFPRVTPLAWQSVAGAASYTVELDCLGCCGAKWCSDMGRTWQLVPNVRTTSHTFNFVGAQPGRWRVWAVAVNGRAGLKTDWREFRYTR